LAILGLRSLYFAVLGALGAFAFLKYGLAAVLTFVGLKMLVSGWVEVPTSTSLGVVALLLGGSILASLRAGKR
jgi:tellurite resistance protein TerC